MARLYADEDIPRPLVLRLRAMTHDVVTVAELGRCGRSDQQVLADALADGRVVLTHNRKHFERLHRAESHAGIISCTRDDGNEEWLANRIEEAIITAGDMTSRHVRVNKPC